MMQGVSGLFLDNISILDLCRNINYVLPLAEMNQENTFGMVSVHFTRIKILIIVCSLM
jgi:hypothetical protein